MVNGYWYYPTDRYESGRNKDIDYDETQYDIDQYSWLTPIIIEDKSHKGRSKNTLKQKKAREYLPKTERTRILELHNNMCDRCKKSQDLHIHHRDKNATNNNIENLDVVCYTCHKEIHKKRKKQKPKDFDILHKLLFGENDQT